MKKMAGMGPPRGVHRKRKILPWSVGSLLVAFALALVAWWLPARSRTGYYIPDTRGAVSPGPSMLDLFWVRPWPWSTQPPPVTVAFHVPGQPEVTDRASPAPVSFFSPRAVVVVMNLSSVTTFSKSGRISEIEVTWPGGSARRTLHDLWAVQTRETNQISGFAPLVTSSSALFGAWPFAVVFSRAPRDVVAVSSPDPIHGPWQTPRCESVKNALDMIQGSPQHMRALIHAMTVGACRELAGPQALVLTGRAPTLPVIYTYQPLVQEVVHGHLETVSSGGSQIWSVISPNAFNWWLFTRSGASSKSGG